MNALFKTHVRGFGFTAHAVGFLPGEGRSAEPFLLLDWPRAWLELYAREGFAGEDAVVAAALTAAEPFTWTELRARQPGASPRIFAAARDFGWTDGLLVPVRIDAGMDSAPEAARIGVVSLAAPTLDGLDLRRRREIIEASTCAFLRAVDLNGTDKDDFLTDRERQAIALVAAGRSDREIGTALGITASTAHFHVEQAKRKLGATTRAQAVALAADMGILPDA